MHCPAGGFAADRGVTDISKSQVPRLCVEIDERVDALLDRPLEGEWPYLGWTPPTSRCGVWGGIVRVAAIVAVPFQARRADAGNRRRQLRRCHHGPCGNRRPVNRLNTQPENNSHHSVGHDPIAVRMDRSTCLSLLGGKNACRAMSGAYGTRRCHAAIIRHQATAIIPVRKNGRLWKEDCPAAQARNETLRVIRHFGRAF